jgi:ABC-2 type transport system ATP-binding protein
MTDAARSPHIAISVVGLSKKFKTGGGLNGVDLEVPFGEVTAMIGRNGAGKSTLIRTISTLILPDEGTVTVDGFDVATQPDQARRRLGLTLGEDRSFFWRLSGRRNLEFFAALHGFSRKVAATATEEALAIVGLTSVADRRVDRYSTGMRSRLGIARSLLGQPSVILLDEPTRSLDPESAKEIQYVMGALASEHNAAVLVATHDMEEAALLARQVIVLSAGQITHRIEPGGDVHTLRNLMGGAPA